MAADGEKPSLTAVAEALGGLNTTDASSRREEMERLEQLLRLLWKGMLPFG